MYPRSLCVFLLALCLGACAIARPEAAAPVAATSCAGNTSTSGDISNLEGCTDVRGDLYISFAKNDLSALSNLRSVSGTLFITGNPNLTSLAGLQNLQRVQKLVIANNPRLQSMAALSSLASVRSLHIAGNPRLKTVSGMDRVEQLEGLIVTGNGIRSVRGLEQLVSVGDLVIARNDKLIDLHGLSQLQFAQNVYIENNPRLAPSGTFLKDLTHVEVQLVIEHNAGMAGSQVAERLAEQLNPAISYVARR